MVVNAAVAEYEDEGVMEVKREIEIERKRARRHIHTRTHEALSRFVNDISEHQITSTSWHQSSPHNHGISRECSGSTSVRVKEDQLNETCKQ